MYCRKMFSSVKPLVFAAVFILGLCDVVAQSDADSTHTKQTNPPAKIMHAEPLYIDLIRDLGARKGEKEWNVGMGMTDRTHFDSYELLVEYEWAVIDRLGLEIEIPVTLFTNPGGSNSLENGLNNRRKPSDRVESIKLAAQYTFLVSEKWQTSLAIGGITEFEFTDLNRMKGDRVFKGMLYNPFLIAAKRWGDHLHSLIYTGPRITTHFNDTKVDYAYEINSNLHYMIPGTRNFVGVEFNKLIEDGELDMVIRPQMRLGISEGFMVGIVPGIPVTKDNERMSAFVRLIYEPGHKHGSKLK